MEKIVFRVLILTSACSLSEKHVFVPLQLNWIMAQKVCETAHTGLTPITNEWEDEAFRRSVGHSYWGWIGCYRELTTTTTVTIDLPLSEDEVSFEDLDVIDVDLPNGQGESKAYWNTNGWILQPSVNQATFFCMSLKIEQEEKSWEEALEHCRERYTDLTSLLSETEIQLAQNHLGRLQITGPVWIGLRYLGDLWLWVNGDPLVYTAWSGNADAGCPVLNRCGVLTEDGLWEERDCLEKLKFICI